jgi:Tol biopolymer transport system component/predicted Ser/Thr protein kinase
MVGRTLNHYRILEKIGAGGMGEVYAAEDLRLHRKVALKVLPGALSDDPARRARFEREATAVAALNHPNIVTVYSVEAADGVHFMTMELVEGKPLSELLPRDGLPLPRFFDLAVPLADAVAAAHRAGVVHRDLKPDNVVVNADGRVKILDFGLAKFDETPRPSSEGSALPTRHLTQEGQILGTVAYMSPEQVEGKALDNRTDVFSLGVVLYEMATGRRPFQGESGASIISSILRDTPASAADLNPRLPRHLARILRQCLAKNPDERFQSAQDVRNQLQDLRREMDSGALQNRRSGAGGAAAGEVAAAGAGTGDAAARGPHRTVLAAAGVIGLAIVAAAAIVVLRRGPAASPSQSGAGFAGTQSKLTDLPGEEVTPSLSPDGKNVAFASRTTGNWDIYVQRVGGSNPVNLTRDSKEDEIQPAFSPDGERIAFRSSRDKGGLYVMGATGESVVRLTNFGYRPAWSPDGTRIAFQTDSFNIPSARPTLSELWVVEVATGQIHKIFDGDAVQPSWSPSGKRIAFWAIPSGGGQRDIWTMPAEGGTPVAVTHDPPLDWNPVWAPDGRHLYFSSERGGSMNLWRVAIDEATGSTQGDPEPVTFGSASALHSATISGDGGRIAYVASVGFSTIRKADLDAAAGRLSVAPAAMGRSSSSVYWLDLSPDGRTLAYTTVGAGEKPGMMREEIVITAVDGSSRRRIAASDSRNRMAVWSPTGERLAFASDRTGTYMIYTVRADGSDLTPYDTSLKDMIYPVWSPTGDRLSMSATAHTVRTIVAPFPRGDRSPEEIALPGEPDVRFIPVSWSPDGASIAGFFQNPNRGGGIVLYHIATRSYERLTDHGMQPFWLPGGRALIFVPDVIGRSLSIVDVATRKVRTLPLDIHGEIEFYNFTVSRDGRTVYFTEEEQEADLWLLDLKP